NSGVLPADDDNTLYMSHFPPRQKIKAAGTGLSCLDFCAYHASFKGAFCFGVMPDQGKGSGCDKGCGNGPAFDNLTASASHEIIETVTDPQNAPSITKAGPPLGW